MEIRKTDGIGAPFAIAIDHQTLQDGTVTLRDRDSMNKIELKFLK